MFNRKEAIVKAIQDKSIDVNTLGVIVDFHTLKGTLSQEEGEHLFTLLNPEPESENEEE